METTYRPSGKFTPAGAIVLFLATAVAGSILSFIYLKLVSWIPFVYLNILLAAGFGVAIAYVAKLIIRKMKIRNVAAVLVAVLLGGLLFTYVKWAMYDYNDGKLLTNSLCDELNCDESDLPKLLKNMKKYSSNKEAFDKIPEIGRSFSDVVFHPGTLFHDIKNINEDGRWTYSSNASSSSKKTDAATVKGPVLTIVWLGEIAIILGTALAMSLSFVKEPFIEKDNEWAKKYDKKFVFRATNGVALKNNLKQNPESILELEPVDFDPNVSDHITGELFHSGDFSECYMTLSLTTIKVNGKKRQSQNHNIISYVNVSNGLIDRIFDRCQMEKPYASAYTAPDNSAYAAQTTPEYSSTNANPDEFFK